MSEGFRTKITLNGEGETKVEKEKFTGLNKMLDFISENDKGADSLRAGKYLRAWFETKRYDLLEAVNSQLNYGGMNFMHIGASEASGEMVEPLFEAIENATTKEERKQAVAEMIGIVSRY